MIIPLGAAPCEGLAPGAGRTHHRNKRRRPFIHLGGSDRFAQPPCREAGAAQPR
jgi:hypothetical protein